MISSIDEINRSNTDIMTQIESSNQQISDIVKVISEIGNKTKVINDIVFQTKLLSFNASVEAARAGEHGKGFAVVAEEVGNLAQMSGNAAKEISQMLEGSIQKVEGIVNETKSSVEKLVVVGKEKVQTGTTTAKQCGEVLDEIVKSVTEVNQMIGEISTASREQAQGVQEINKAMSQMDQVTQQNAASSQEIAGAAEQLASQAESLRTMVEGLMKTVEGRKGGHVESASSSPSLHSRPSKVVELKKFASKSKKASVPEQSLRDVVPAKVFKKAVGAENIPVENDPRFEDV
jgi:methyl-accepting chemotaxis protein